MSHHSPYRPSLRSLWVAVALIACVWALPWMLWIGATPEAPALRHTQKPPRVVYVRRTLGDSAPWSPVVFALPTSWGFRWTGRTNATEAMALAGPSAGVSAYFEAGPKDAPDSVSQWRLASPALSSLADGPTAWAESDVRVFASGAGNSNSMRGTVWFSQSLEMRGFKFNVPPVAGSTNGSSAVWLMAQAMVELDCAGAVTHVVLDSSSSRSEWDQALVRALRTGLAAAADTPTRGSVRVGMSGL
ncbi:MAG: hypothetical protein WCL16_03475 [bacterium]